MKSLFLRLTFVLVVAVGVTACRAAPVYNVESERFIGNATLAQRADQIKRAGAGLGWAMEDISPGVMQGTLNLRSHKAVVLINYTPSNFSIRYKDSANLDYTGTEIHKNYNGWVQRLQQAIVSQSSV
jgi:hypothetical protein